LASLLSAVLSEVCGKDEEQLRGIILSIAALFQELPATGGGVFSRLNASAVET
jgi:hypothetical protein